MYDCDQVHTFYEAVGLMIGAQTDQVQQERLVEKYMSLPNQVWDSIINQATQVRHVQRTIQSVMSAILLKMLEENLKKKKNQYLCLFFATNELDPEV